MKPLYKYVLDEDTGKITVQEISDYHIKENEYTHRKTYVHKEKYGTVYTREESFDQLKHNTVYSFNPDIEHAKEIIWKSILEKFDKASEQKQKWEIMLKKLSKECL